MIIPVEASWTDTQKKIIAITPKITSFLSIVGSSYIIYHCLGSEYFSSSKTKEANRKTIGEKRGFQSSMYIRILMVLSFCDLVSSSGWFLSTWPIPKDDVQGMSLYNIGNRNSCNLQGLMLTGGNLGGACYNACLSVYFCLLVRNKIDKKEKKKNRKKLEFIFHFVSLTFPLSTAVFGVFKGYMNPTPSNCYISEYPRGCIGDECVRGQFYKRFRVYSTLFPLIILFLIIAVSMFLLQRSVKQLEKQTLKRTSIVLDASPEQKKETSENKEGDHHDHTSNNDIETLEQNNQDGINREDINEKQTQVQSATTSKTENNPKKKNILISQTSKKTFRVAFLYVAAFLTCSIPLIFRTIITKFFVEDPTVLFVSGLLVQIFCPLQGVFNALIYRNFNPLTFLCRFLFCPCLSCLGKQRKNTNMNSGWSDEYEYVYEYKYEYYDDEEW